MADALALMPVMNGGPPAPIEGATSKGGGFGPAYDSAWWSNVGGMALTRQIGDVRDDTHVNHDDAAKAITAQGLDPAFIPPGGVTQGALVAEAKRQAEIKYDQLKLQRSGTGAWTQNTASFIAGASDPINLALPAVGGLIAKAGAPLAGRLAIGAAEGAGYVAAQRAAQLHMTGHDQDMWSWETLNQLTLGAGLGGLSHAAFGARPTRVEGSSYVPPTDDQMAGYRQMIQTGEGVEAYAKARGLDPDTFVSKPAASGGKGGAIGLNQVEPGTAKAFGLDPTRLTEREYNQMASDTIIRDLHKRFGNDPEAIAIGYNGGPGLADRFIKAGRDRSMLPEQTRQYLNRIARDGKDITFGKMPLATDISGYVEPEQQGLPFQEEMHLPKPEGEQGELGLRPPWQITGPPHYEGGQLEFQYSNDIQANVRQWMHEAVTHVGGGIQDEMQFPDQPPPSQMRFGLPFQSRVDALTLGMQQMAADNPVDVSPVFRTDNAPARGPEDMESRRAQVALWQDAKPDPQRIVAPPPQIAARLDAMGKVKPEEQNDLVGEAKAHMETLGPDAAKRLNDEVAMVATAHEEGTSLTHDELTKATQAAVQCGVMKGLNYGGD